MVFVAFSAIIVNFDKTTTKTGGYPDGIHRPAAALSWFSLTISFWASILQQLSTQTRGRSGLP